MTTYALAGQRCAYQPDAGNRCTEPATAWIEDPDGCDVPGYYVCHTHARLLLAEYAATLGEHWSIHDLDPAPIHD